MTNSKAIQLHEEKRGKLEIHSKVKLETKEDLSLAYTPGVAEACLDIAKNPSRAYNLSSKSNMVAVVTDGSAVLGLGDIGPLAALPVMEGKAILFKAFGDVDAFPICLDTKSTEEIIRAVELIAPSFGGINLEDISAPRCFEIEERLKEALDIPVFHDDQHGTAVVVLAATINALKITNRDVTKVRAVINGAGAAGVAICKILQGFGIKDIVVLDSLGVISKDRKDGMNSIKEALSRTTNPNNINGDLRVALEGADIFIGVSKGNIVDSKMIKSMNKDPIIFAMANPLPEIYPVEAIESGAKIVGTGRSDFPNQINNVLAFPGIFRGALDANATKITEGMIISAALALADLVEEKELAVGIVIPSIFNPNVKSAVSKAVFDKAIEENVTRHSL